MSSIICTIRITPGKNIVIPAKLMQSLGLQRNNPLQLSFGSKSAQGSLRSIRRSQQLMDIPSSLAEQLHLPVGGKCMLSSNGAGEVRIGPLIALLAARRAGEQGYYGHTSAYYRQLAAAARGKAFFCVFSPKDVDWDTETVHAYFPGANGSWVKRQVPLPDVVYNRLQSRQAENLVAMHAFKERFLLRSIPLFNWGFFDKSDVYQMLQGEEVHRHIPETRDSPTATEIRDMLAQHKNVYLKPSAGSLGMGIYRVQQLGREGYSIRYRYRGKNYSHSYRSFDRVMRLLSRQHKRRLDQYVVQQGISLIEIEGCPVDFRFHMTKNKSNQWAVAAIGAKKAGKGSITTHVSSGGRLLRASDVLQSAFGQLAPRVLNRVKTAVMNIANALERNHPYLLGEIGFDIGIDRTGHIWMFEANAKPGRSIFKHPQAKQEERDTLTNLIDYCVHLSKFWRGGNEVDNRARISGKTSRRSHTRSQG